MNASETFGFGCLVALIVSTPILFLWGHYSDALGRAEVGQFIFMGTLVFLAFSLVTSDDKDEINLGSGCVIPLILVGLAFCLFYFADPLYLNWLSISAYVILPILTMPLIAICMSLFDRNNKIPMDEIDPEVVGFLSKFPETPRPELVEMFPKVSAKSIDLSVSKAFDQLLESRLFDKANDLNECHDIDDNNLLPVLIALDYHKKTGELKLEPRIYKISITDSETAYEKLPCNWQKIHTYLAPLEDEVEQADILDTGNIYLTDQRVFFVGNKGSETVYLNDIAYMDHKEDALQFFHDEGLSEIFAFPTPHHATYARLVIEELMNRQT